MLMHDALSQTRMTDNFHQTASPADKLAEDAQAVFVRLAAIGGEKSENLPRRRAIHRDIV